MRRLLAPLLVVLPACGVDAIGGVDAGVPLGDMEPAECVAAARTCSDVKAAFISSATDVTVSCEEAAGTFTIRSSGVPPYLLPGDPPAAIERLTSNCGHPFLACQMRYGVHITRAIAPPIHGHGVASVRRGPARHRYLT